MYGHTFFLVRDEFNFKFISKYKKYLVLDIRHRVALQFGLVFCIVDSKISCETWRVFMVSNSQMNDLTQT